MIRRLLRRAAGAVAAAGLVVGLAACAPAGLSETGEPLTVAQAERLAAARFQLTARDEFGARVASGAADDVQRITADLTVSGSDHAAWGVLHRGPDGLAVDEDLAFTADEVATKVDGGWRASAWSEASDLAPLGVVLGLIADRPENAQLLRQSDARFLGTEQTDGAERSVFRLPSSDGGVGKTRIWLDADGAIVRLDDGGDGLVITITDAPAGERPAIVDAMLSEKSGP